MAQKFSSIEEAASQLGISKDRLNQIREAGKIRAYRDGASWKFRQDDIDRLVRDGIPAIDPGASDIALDLGDEPALPTPTAAEQSGLDLDLADEPSSTPASDVNLDDVEEPTVAGEGDFDDLALDMGDSVDMSDSILLSEAELGESTDRPPSTIIGRAELDADLDITPKGQKKPAHMSDVQLAPTSDIISAGDDDLALDMEPPSPSDNFQGLEELEVDLEAESSRILSPQDVEKAQAAAKAQQAKAAQPSDLELAPSDSDAARAASDIGLGGESAVGTGLTGLSALELEDDEDDQVLGEGSDVTLSSESSGINIISPSDSGLALDEVPLDLSGSTPMGSSLDLGGALDEDEVELQPLGVGSDAVGESGVGGVFQLTPIGEESGDEEKDSSQVIALDEISEEAGEPIGAGFGDHGVMGEEFGAVGLVPGAMITEPASETPFSGAVVAGLSLSLLMLALCGMMVFDLMRNIWSWDGVTTLNSSLLEVLNPML